MLARYSRTFMLKDLGVLDYNKDGVNYDWDRVSELIEMIDSEFD